MLVLVLALLGACSDDDGDGDPGDGSAGDATESSTSTTGGPSDTAEGGSDTAEGGSDTAEGDRGGTLVSVTFGVRSDAGGYDHEFEVTAEQVESADDPSSTWISCDAANVSSPELIPRAYVVTVIDRTRDQGLRTAGVEATEDVDGPGTYEARLQFSDSSGRYVEAEGELTIADDGRSGTFEGTDPGGDDVTGSYRCNV